MRKAVFYTLIVCLALCIGCSPESNSVISKSYHNLTAHYNGFYYANEEITKIEQTILKSHVDDYNRILRLFPTFDSTLSKSYEKEAEEAVKMASLSIQRHPNSNWVDDAYILVGKARLYTQDWGNAIQTFKYVNTKSKDPNAKHRAIISLVRTFTEYQEYDNAQAAIEYLLKQKLNKANRKNLLLEKAYFHQIRNDYDNMVRSLTEADPLLTKKDRRGRIYFIIGQVYQELGFESEAFNYYKKCLTTNPEYEVDFYARLYMAQVAEISKNKNIHAARRSFKKLLKDRKNKEFKDKIYYEMGVFELKQKNIEISIENFNSALRAGSNKQVHGEAYLRLGEVYYDTLKDYELSQAYYDSAIQSLPPTYENYAVIKSRQEILNEFVKHLKTIQWQDSLLRMASLDSISLRKKIDSVYAIKKKQEELAARKNKKKANRIELTSSNSIFDTGEGTAGTGNWYFGNPASIAFGETEFKKVWGNIALADNWRRSLKSSQAEIAQPIPMGNELVGNNTAKATENIPIDPAAAEFERISKEVPRTDDQKKAALKKIEEAYFKLGDINYFKLNEKNDAVIMYEKLLRRFPKSEYEPEVLYKLYLIFKDTHSDRANYYADQVKSNYPNSSFAKILINPNYLKESSQAAEKQKFIYKDAYMSFQNHNYEEATRLIGNARQLGETSFSPNLDLLSILILGQAENIATYQFALQEFIKAHPGHDLASYAEKLLTSSREFELSVEKRKGIQYTISSGVHYFVLVYQKTEKLTDVASGILETFNTANFQALSLKTSNLILDDTYAISIVSDLATIQAATEYYKAFTDKLPTINELRNYKFNKFVITKENFDIFYRTKGLDEYIRFFEKNYQSENQ